MTQSCGHIRGFRCSSSSHMELGQKARSGEQVAYFGVIVLTLALFALHAQPPAPPALTSFELCNLTLFKTLQTTHKKSKNLKKSYFELPVAMPQRVLHSPAVLAFAHEWSSNCLQVVFVDSVMLIFRVEVCSRSSGLRHSISKLEIHVKVSSDVYSFFYWIMYGLRISLQIVRSMLHDLISVSLFVI